MNNNAVLPTSSSYSSEQPQQQCSSGCESGWTLYLEHSNTTRYFSDDDNKYQNQVRRECDDDDNDGFYSEDDEEEDLSMVSDASSGPPHFDHDLDLDLDDVEIFCYGNGGRKAKSIKLTHHCKTNDFDALDDTASSPIIVTSKKNNGNNIDGEEDQGSSFESLMDYSSQGFSATHFQGRSTNNNFQEHYEFFQDSTFSTDQQYQLN